MMMMIQNYFNCECCSVNTMLTVQYYYLLKKKGKKVVSCLSSPTTYHKSIGVLHTMIGETPRSAHV